MRRGGQPPLSCKMPCRRLTHRLDGAGNEGSRSNVHEPVNGLGVEAGVFGMRFHAARQHQLWRGGAGQSDLKFVHGKSGVAGSHRFLTAPTCQVHPSVHDIPNERFPWIFTGKHLRVRIEVALSQSDNGYRPKRGAALGATRSVCLRNHALDSAIYAHLSGI